MAKVAIVTDTNSGIMPEEAKQHGVFVFPMPFTIDEDDYLEAVNLSRDQFYDKMAAGADIKTSQPSLETLMKLWEELLQEYDEIIHIPMSSGLSGSYQSARMLAADYDSASPCWMLRRWRIKAAPVRRFWFFWSRINSTAVSTLCWIPCII